MSHTRYKKRKALRPFSKQIKSEHSLLNLFTCHALNCTLLLADITTIALERVLFGWIHSSGPHIATVCPQHEYAHWRIKKGEDIRPGRRYNWFLCKPKTTFQCKSVQNFSSCSLYHLGSINKNNLYTIHLYRFEVQNFKYNMIERNKMSILTDLTKHL